MLEKNDLLSILNEGLKTEEEIIPIYSKHIDNALFFSSFSEENKRAIKEILMMLRDDSLRHKKMFEGVIAEVKISQKDVY